MDTAQVRYRVLSALVLSIFSHSTDLFANELLATDRQAVDEVAEAFPEHAFGLEAACDFLVEHRLGDGERLGLVGTLPR